jgi:hypothetical protein
MTETLVAVSTPPKDPTDPPSAEALPAAKELVRRARAEGIALTGPGGLSEAAGAQVDMSVITIDEQSV